MSYKKRPLPIGKTFNYLTILEEVPTNEKCRRYVYCECECGSKKTLRYDGVQSGRIKSCGCLLSTKNESQIQKMILTRRKKRETVIVEQYIGKKFGLLKIKSLYNHPRAKATWFLVECECGKTIPVSLTRLKIGHTKSCGCIRRKNKAIKFISSIDGEEILVSNEKCQYLRTVKDGSLKSKEFIHVHEAKKAFRLQSKEWLQDFVVHHMDGDKKNNTASNLSVFDNNKDHRLFHGKLERKMWEFMASHDLLAEFYDLNPDLKLKSIADA